MPTAESVAIAGHLKPQTQRSKIQKFPVTLNPKFQRRDFLGSGALTRRPCLLCVFSREAKGLYEEACIHMTRLKYVPLKTPNPKP